MLTKSRTEVQRGEHDRQLNRGRRIHSQKRENDDKLLPKPSRLIRPYHIDHVLFSVLFSLLLVRYQYMVQDAVLTAKGSLLIPRLELATKSGNASSRRSVDGVVLDPDQRDFSGNVQGLQTTASSRINSYTDLNRIDETRGSNTVEGGHSRV